jgi:hypothetical protein
LPEGSSLTHGNGNRSWPICRPSGFARSWQTSSACRCPRPWPGRSSRPGSPRPVLWSSETTAAEGLLSYSRRQIAFWDLLDQVPTDVQMPGDIFNRHVPGKLQCIACKGPGVAAPLIVKANRHLPNGGALPALHPGDAHSNHIRVRPDGSLPPQPMNTAMLKYIVAATYREDHRERIRFHSKDDPTADIAGAHILLAADPPPSMLQQTRGHTLALLCESWLALSLRNEHVCPRFSIKSPHESDEP